MIKTLLSDKRLFLLVVAIAVVIISTIITSIRADKLERRSNALKSQLTEIHSLRRGIIQIKRMVESKEKKIGLTKVTGVVATLEQILESLKIKADVIKPLGKKRIQAFIEEDAEVEIREIDLNSIVNLLYKIDNSPAPLKIKDVTMRTTFADPDKFNLNITVSLIHKT
jgi:hypothetical protein